MSTRAARPQATVPYTLRQGSPSSLGVSFTPPTPALRGRPPVILVHGLSGDMRLWQSRPPDRLPAPLAGAHPLPPPPIPRVVMREAPWEDPTGLWERLEAAGLAGVAWKQNDGSGALPGDTDRELAAVISFALGTYGAKQACLVTHSRGGLTARAYLTHPDAPARVALLVTIGTPHYGTRIATVPQIIEKGVVEALLGRLGFVGQVAGFVVTPRIIELLNTLTMRLFGTDVDMIAWKAPYNTRLIDLMAASYHPQVRYVAIAGVIPYVNDLRLYHYTVSSYLPVVNFENGPQVRFQWQETTYPPPDQPPAPFSQVFGELADERGIGALQAMPEIHAQSLRQPEGGDGLVPKWSAWFADEERDPARGYIRNVKFAIGHSLMARRREVHDLILQEIRAAIG